MSKASETSSSFFLLSPDGFTLTQEQKEYTNLAQAEKDFSEWKKQFENQGYYSSNKGRVPLSELKMITHNRPFKFN